MNSRKKHFSSVKFVVCFLLIIASQAANAQIKFAYTAKEETDKGNYMEKTDGTKVYGKDIDYRTGTFSAGTVSVDGVKYKMDEVKGYMVNKIYFGKFDKDFLPRVVKGNINVYQENLTKSVYYTEKDGREDHYDRDKINYYYETGNNGEFKKIKDIDDIAQLVKDCPAAFDLANIKTSQLKKELKDDLGYLNHILDMYNNGCK